ncbi:MAG: hypothetical protein ACTSQ8_22535 [Candidatus Helarchaeota archaeon]
MLDTILTVKNEDLNRLGPKEAVDFFRELLWAEATSLGIGKVKIDVPSAIYIPDGGIDAEVRDAEVPIGQGIIKQGNTHYQIKTGDFRISENKYIDGILFKNGHQLKKRVKTCLDNSGNLVVVLFGFDAPDREDSELLQKFMGRLRKFYPEYNDPKIEIWRQNQIIGFLSKFPSLALRANHNWKGFFQTHDDWSSHEDMQKDFFPDENQDRKIQSFRKALEENERPIHIRVWGEPGIGKTKLVLEVTRIEKFRPLVIYTKASLFFDSELLRIILSGGFNCILVLDECDSSMCQQIWNVLKSHSPRIKLITIYGEFDDFRDINYVDLEPLNDESIKKILKSYGLPPEIVFPWTNQCSGSPLVAHVLGNNLRNNPDDLLATTSTDNIWERYIIGVDAENKNSAIIKQRERILKFLALFKRFGFGSSVEDEAKQICGIIEQVDRQITWVIFCEAIKTLRDRRILQGENTLFITPKLLHVWLWTKWWDTYDSDTFFEIYNNVSASLRDWALEMLEYAAGSSKAFLEVRKLLSSKGPFMNNPDIFKGDRGARFFRYLAKADPKSALKCLKKTIGRWSKDQLLGFTTGRRQIIWALEDIVQYESLFADGAKLLLSLAISENESFTNNGSGIFTSLFNITEHGPLAKTEAPPKDRFLILKETIESEDKDKRLMGLRAAKQALTRQSFGGPIASPRVFGRRPTPWKPKTWGELYEAYQQVWEYLSNRIDQFNEDEQQIVVDILTKNARGLNMHPSLSEMIIKTFRELSEKKFVQKNELLETISQILHFEGKIMPEEIRVKWEELQSDLTGTDYPSRLKRYISMQLIEDQYDETGKPSDQIGKKIEELAEEGVKSPEKIFSELPWIIKIESQNAFRLGYQVGKRDQKISLYYDLIKIQKQNIDEANEVFLGGYLRAIHEDEPQTYSIVIEDLLRDEIYAKIIPSLIWRSGALSNEYASMILDLINRNVIEYRQLRMFVYGNEVRKLSRDIINQWIGYLIRVEERLAVDIAFDLFSQYYIRLHDSTPLPKKLTLDLIQSPVLFQAFETQRQGDQMTPYHWSEIGKRFLKDFPQHRVNIIELIIDHFRETGTIFSGFHSYSTELLYIALQSDPEGIWNLIAQRIQFPLPTNLYYLFQWLRGDDMFADEKNGAMQLFPEKLLWDWIDEDIEQRASFIASYLPPNLFHSEERDCLARVFLVRYDTEEAKLKLMSNFSYEGWTGPESLHFRKKIDQLREFQSSEKNEKVNNWINEYIYELEKREEDARIREERDYL